jgi:colanic acid/amylovoran biosynthesis protein
VLVADPAFLLVPRTIDPCTFWPRARRVIGLNISSLAARFQQGLSTEHVVNAAAETVRAILRMDGWGVLLIPHVTHAGGTDDYTVLSQVQQAVGLGNDRLMLMPPTLSAGHIKWAIAQCDLVVAARTHATISAYSSGVPALVIAYSRKALGIAADLGLGDRWVFDIRTEDVGHLASRVEKCLQTRDEAAAILLESAPRAIASAESGFTHLRTVLRRQTGSA